MSISSVSHSFATKRELAQPKARTQELSESAQSLPIRDNVSLGAEAAKARRLERAEAAVSRLGFGREVSADALPKFGELPPLNLPGLKGLAGIPEREPSPEELLPYDEALDHYSREQLQLARDRRQEVDPNASVAVIDSFGQNFGSSHGNQVEYVLNNETPETQATTQRFEVSPNGHPPTHLFTAEGDATPEERVTAFVEQTTADMMRQTNTHLDSILSDPDSNIRTINQSQGISPADQAEYLMQTILARKEDGTMGISESGKVIFEALGMEPRIQEDYSHVPEFMTRATKKIEEIFHTSEVLGPELARHTELSEELADKGVSYVVSAGNSGDFGAHLGDKLNLQPGFDDNVLSNPHNITVGALDPARGAMADFSSRDPEVDFVAQGVNVRVGDREFDFNDGTSFAAPIVADRLDNLRAQHPNISQAELLRLFGRLNPATVPGVPHSIVQ